MLLEKSTLLVDDVIRKMSTVSMDEPLATRKISTLSEAYYDYIPCESDATPHINLGKAFQARVKKWSDREIMPHEREAIADRDEILFDCNIIDHLDDQTGKQSLKMIWNLEKEDYRLFSAESI